MRVEGIGYGCGQKEFEVANCVRAMCGETADNQDYIVELRCNLDDMTPEAVGFAMEELFAAGALDVYTTAVGMKKNRPGILLTCMCKEKQREEMEKLQALEVNGRIHFGELPVLEPRIREILLKWLSDAMESADFSARTDDGRRYILDRSRADETCVVHCLDGNFTMPDLSIVFQEET